MISINIYGQNSDLPRLDSLFTHHIESIDFSIQTFSNNTKHLLSWKDAPFLYMLSSLPDFKFEFHGYTHQPMINRSELNKIKRWYLLNKTRLNYSAINRYLFLFRKVFDPKFTEEESEKINNEMDSLKLFIDPALPNRNEGKE